MVNYVSTSCRRLGKMKRLTIFQDFQGQWRITLVTGRLQKYLENLCFLVEEIYILLGKDLLCEDTDKAEQSLTQCQFSFQRLYGLENCGLNIHNIGNHFAHYVKLHGPLWGLSCFAFEDMNGTLLKLAPGTDNLPSP